MTTETATQFDVRSHLKMLFRMNHSLLTKNLEGVTDDIANAKPGDGNPIAWSLGHIVYWRQTLIGMLGGTPVWDASDVEGFKGTSRELPATIDRTWSEIVDGYQESHTQLMAALTDHPEPSAEVIKGMSQLQCHETYHVGQLALARRVAGLPGVI